MIKINKKQNFKETLTTPVPSRATSPRSLEDTTWGELQQSALFTPSYRSLSPTPLPENLPRYRTTFRGFNISPRSLQFYPILSLKCLGADELRNLILLKPSYYNELIAESVEKKRFLNPQDIKKYQITNVNGIFYKQDGSVVDGAMLFILLPD